MTYRRAALAAVTFVIAGCMTSPTRLVTPAPTRTPPPVRQPVGAPTATTTTTDTATSTPSIEGVAQVIAGSVEKGNEGDGGPATEAALFKPIGLGLAPDGTLYVTECDPNGVTAAANRVRRIASDGVIQTIVGGVKSEPGFSGDGGLATDAQLNCPFAVAADGDGNVYIADVFNNRVRMIDAGGLITTIAGTGEALDAGDNGPAGDASLHWPGDVLIAPDAALLIASGPYIREIAADGTITIVAGGGSPPDVQLGIPRWTDEQEGTPAIDASFSDSGGMVWGPEGSLYFADYWDNRVLQIDAQGLLHSIAGDGTKPTNIDDEGDGGMARNAKLRNPADVAIGPDGSLYILEHFGFIRRVTPDGIISTVDIGRTYNQAQSVVADDRYLYIADREGAVVLRYPFDR